MVVTQYETYVIMPLHWNLSQRLLFVRSHLSDLLTVLEIQPIFITGTFSKHFVISNLMNISFIFLILIPSRNGARSRKSTHPINETVVIFILPNIQAEIARLN